MCVGRATSEHEIIRLSFHMLYATVMKISIYIGMDHPTLALLDSMKSIISQVLIHRKGIPAVNNEGAMKKRCSTFSSLQCSTMACIIIHHIIVSTWKQLRSGALNFYWDSQVDVDSLQWVFFSWQGVLFLSFVFVGTTRTGSLTSNFLQFSSSFCGVNERQFGLRNNKKPQ